MNPRRTARLALRQYWLLAHRWLGLTLGLVGVLLGVSGSVLVFDAEIDARLNPARHAVSAGAVARPYSEYLDAAAKASGPGARSQSILLPAGPGAPVIVVTRTPRAEGLSRVYLDPPSARVMDVARGGGFIAWMHGFHGALMLREFWGRELVGVVGVAMFISALSGIYLWWPRAGRLSAALGFRPGLALSRNLHYTFGLYAAIVLAIISFTGVYLAFPRVFNQAVTALSPDTYALRGGQAPTRAAERGKVDADPASMLGVDRIAEIARASAPGAAISSIALAANATAPYRVTMREMGDPHTLRGGNTLLLVDSRNGTLLRRLDATTRVAGDRFLAWQMPLHTGEAFGLPGRVAASIAGLVPLLLFASGMLMWLRPSRRARRRRGAGFPTTA